MYDIEKQHSKKKYHAIERITLLFDKSTFVELDEEEYDGVIVGYGMVHNKKVFVYAQDFTYIGGTIGKRHGERIARTIEAAMEGKCPVVGVYDSGGARIGEGINSLAGCGRILEANIKASGFIPQIALVLGPCAGAAVYSPVLSDFVFAVNTISNMYITGPKVIQKVTGEVCDAETLGGVSVHASLSGQVHVVCISERECFEKTREFITLLPDSFDRKRQIDEVKILQTDCEWQDVIPIEQNRTYDMKKLVSQYFDRNMFFELLERFAESMMIGFGVIAGMTIGVIANQPKFNAGVIDHDASDKAARFLRFCDAFDIPVITFVDTPGYLPGIEEEHKGIIRHGAKLLYAYAEATTICLTVIVRKAFGGAYIAMGSKHLGSNAVCAFPNAQIGVMVSERAVAILNQKELDDIEDEDERKRLFDKKAKKYRDDYLNTDEGIAQGYIDEIVEPKALREWIIKNISNLPKKDVGRIMKKHGNIPL